MNAVIIAGSPHKKGTSSLLADEFIRGVQEAGHDTVRFDTAFLQIKGCLGCDHCRKTGEPCIHHDDMEKISIPLLNADVVVFVTPIYYFGVTSQLKAVIDRFYAQEQYLRGKKKAVLMLTAGSPEPNIAKNVTGLYHDILHWMQWENAGEILAVGCYDRNGIEKSPYPRKAYELGKKIFV